jgi:hypothetical protein
MTPRHRNVRHQYQRLALFNGDFLIDVTSVYPWAWPDFMNSGLASGNTKKAGGQSGILFVDEAGFILTSDQTSVYGGTI